MGYSTEFTGELRFTSEATAKQLSALAGICGQDCRDHPEWDARDLYYIDLELTQDFGGLRWSGAEKTYDLEKIVNLVLRVMRAQWPDFSLTGTLLAQGEEFDDRWQLVMGEDGQAHKVPVVLTGKIVTCPHCDRRFELEAGR